MTKNLSKMKARQQATAYMRDKSKKELKATALLSSLREVSKHIIMAQEEERSRIAQEIHNDLGQSLIVLKMYIASIISGKSIKGPQLKQAYKKVNSQLGDIINKARDLSHKLSPPSLKYIGLTTAFKKLAEFCSFDKKLKIKLTHKNMAGVTLGSNDIIVYRIVQEALNNIIKHAKATEVTIEIVHKHGTIFIEVRDNGKGFNHEKLSKEAGIGLGLMRERARLANGALDVSSCPGKGTSIKMVVPVRDKDNYE